MDIIGAHVGIDQQMVGLTSVDLVKDWQGKSRFLSPLQGGSMRMCGGGGEVRGRDRHRRGKHRPIRRCDGLHKEDPQGHRPPGHPVKRSVAHGMRRSANSSQGLHPEHLGCDAPQGGDAGILSICGNVKMAGGLYCPTFAGDWAKPVETIDIAKKDEVIVINNDGVTDVAPGGSSPPGAVR